MKRRNLLLITLSLMVVLGGLAACIPASSEHTCQSKCITCGKCTDLTCEEKACEDKCGGHSQTPEICTIYFDANGGAFADGSTVKEQLVRYEQTVMKISEEPTYSGYMFEGWGLNGELYDFSTPVTSETVTLKAMWDSETLLGEGTLENPYKIEKANDLLKLENSINEGDEKYLTAYYQVSSDINASDITISPLGSEAKPFAGNFDGNGKTISNLTVEVKETGSPVYAGLFGVALNANIENVTLENITLNVTETSSTTKLITAGALAAKTTLTPITNVTVSGAINIKTLDVNNIIVGGVIGYAESGINEDNVGLITVVRGVNSNVNIQAINAAGNAHPSSYVGGVIGAATNEDGAFVINNVINSATVKGSVIAGGIVGEASNNFVTISDCLNKGPVVIENTAATTFAGGIVGHLVGDCIVIDCLNTGNVSCSGTDSYAGGIVGFGSSDNYMYYYTPGVAVVNSYFTRGVVGGEVSTLGKKTDSEINSAFLTNTLKWANITLANGEYKLSLSELPKTVTVTLKDNNQVHKTFTVDAGSVLGKIDSLKNSENVIFHNWSYGATIADYNGYRYYMCMLKDLTLNAVYSDVSSLVGTYKGAEEKNGSFVLNADGTCARISEVATYGTYTYLNGYLFINYSDEEAVGEVDASGKITIVKNEGMNDYIYEYTKYNPAVCGEFLNDNGDLLVFSGEQSVRLERDGQVTSFTYTASSGVITLSDATTLSIQQDGSLKVATSSGSTFTVEDVFLSLGTSALINEEILGNWYALYLNGSSYSDTTTQSYYVYNFTDSGTLYLNKGFGDYAIRYYYIDSTSTVKYVLDGYVSNVKYLTIGNEKVIYGLHNGGIRGYQQPVLLLRNDSDMKAYRFDMEYSGRAESFVIVNGDVAYVVYRGELITDATVQGKFDANSVVTLTINGENKSYLVNLTTNPDNYANSLIEIGAEVGSYNGEKGEIILDGTNTVSGAVSGTYYVKDEKVIVKADGTFFAFNYVTAHQNNNAYSLLTADGMQGVYLIGELNKPESKMLEVDGFGNARYYYYSDIYEEYRLNWGESTNESYQKIDDNCVYLSLNSSRYGFIIKLDDNTVRFAVAYKNYQGDVIDNELVLSKNGTPSAQSPVFDEKYVGAWKNGSSVITIIAEGEMLYNGSESPFVYTGKGIAFNYGGTIYYASLSQDGSTLTVNGTAYTKDEGAGEIIRGDFAKMIGSWMYIDASTQTLVINEDYTVKYGTVTFNATLSEDGKMLTFGDDANEFQVTYDSTTGYLEVHLIYDYMDSWTHTYIPAD
ncbi:MAG: InlB B-repeat-containing protein [Clostridia bacterium]|nr:InlB B-repeat-containing protein [Clostridia bacterium]